MYDPIVAEALRRREILDNLQTYLRRLKETALKVDPEAKIYLFGSVAEGKHTYSSDVDVLIITERDRLEMFRALLAEEFIKFFEIHVRNPKEAWWYRRMTKLVEV